VGAEVIWASTRGLLDKAFHKGDLTPATTVNHFLRGFVLGTKIPLLRSLRSFYEEGGVPPHPQGPRSLDDLLPRSYDLRELHELESFLDDMACSQAEAIFQWASKSPASANVSQLKAAVDVLSSLASTGGLPCCHAVPGRAAPLFQAEGPKGSSGREHETTVKWLLVEGQTVERELAQRGGAPHRQRGISGLQNVWLLKESGKNCGRGVEVWAHHEALLRSAASKGWNVLTQKYIEKPLLAGGRKFDLRVWVVVTSWNALQVWVHDQPYARLSKKVFSSAPEAWTDTSMHLTNRAVQKVEGEEAEIAGPRDSDEPWIWLLPKLIGSGGAIPAAKWKEKVWPSIVGGIAAVAAAVQQDLAFEPEGGPARLELFGFDFILDSGYHPWFLEANSAPDMCPDAGPSLRNWVQDACHGIADIIAATRAGTSLEETGHWHRAISSARLSTHMVKAAAVQRTVERRRLASMPAPARSYMEAVDRFNPAWGRRGRHLAPAAAALAPPVGPLWFGPPPVASLRSSSACSAPDSARRRSRRQPRGKPPVAQRAVTGPQLPRVGLPPL